MAQYTIPQKTQREDTIMGPLTVKNLLSLMVATVGGFILFSSWNINPIFIFNFIERVGLTLPFVLLALAFGFVNMYGRTFDVVFVAFINFLRTPRVRTWQKEVVIPEEYDTEQILQQLQEEQDKGPTFTKEVVSYNKIAELSKMLDRPGVAAKQMAAAQVASGGPSSQTMDLLKALDQSASSSQDSMQKLEPAKNKGFLHMLIVIIIFPFKLPFLIISLPFKILLYPFRRHSSSGPKVASGVVNATPEYLQDSAVSSVLNSSSNVVQSAESSSGSGNQAVSPDDLLSQLEQLKNKK